MMSTDSVKIQEQALVSVLAAAEKLGISLAEVYDIACKLTEQEGSKILFVHPRDAGDVALAISLATAKVKGLVR